MFLYIPQIPFHCFTFKGVNYLMMDNLGAQQQTVRTTNILSFTVTIEQKITGA